MPVNEKFTDNCSDCKKEFSVYDLIQIWNSKGGEKYRMVCENCFKKHPEYKFVGIFRG